MSITNFTNGKNTIDASQVDFFREHYIYANHNSSSSVPTRVVNRWYPTALIPFDATNYGGTVDTEQARYWALPHTVRPNEVIPFFVDVNIPEDAVPGEYTAAYTITTADGTPYTGDITLRVWNHKMPSVSSTYTAVTMKPSGDWNGNTYTTHGSYGYGFDTATETGYMGYGDYLTILESMKNGYNVVDPNIVWDDMSQNMLTQEQAKSLVANGTRIVEAGFWGLMDYGFIDMASMEQATSELYHYHSEPHNNLTGVEVIKQRAKDLREMYGDDVLIVDYLIDEIEAGYNQTIAQDKATNPGDPNGYGLDGEFNSDVEKAHDVIRQKLYEWKLALKEADIKLMAVSKPFSDLFDSSDLAQKAWEADGGTGAYDPDKYYDGPIVDIFVTKATFLQGGGVYGTAGLGLDAGRTVFDLVDEARAKGLDIEFWSYNAQGNSAPSWVLDTNPVAYRVNSGFINQSLGFTGYLNWTLNTWNIDPWSMPGVYQNSHLSDTVGIFPADQLGMKGAVPSLQLKSARDGIYDYDYIQELKNIGLGELAMEIVQSAAPDSSEPLGFYNWKASTDTSGAAAAQTLIDKRIALGKLFDLKPDDSSKPVPGELSLDVPDQAKNNERLDVTLQSAKSSGLFSGYTVLNYDPKKLQVKDVKLADGLLQDKDAFLAWDDHKGQLQIFASHLGTGSWEGDVPIAHIEFKAKNKAGTTDIVLSKQSQLLATDSDQTGKSYPLPDDQNYQITILDKKVKKDKESSQLADNETIQSEDLLMIVRIVKAMGDAVTNDNRHLDLNKDGKINLKDVQSASKEWMKANRPK